MRQWLSVLLIFALALPPVVLADEGSRKPRETRKTEKLSPAVYEQIAEAQVALDEQRLADAESILQTLLADREALTHYEQAQALNFLAAVHYEQGRTDATIEDYKSLLRLPDGVPEQLRDNSLFRLAQLYFVQADYETSIRALDAWMQRVEAVRPEAWLLKAQAYYQLDRHAEAEPAIIEALREARRRKQPLQENWLALLRAVYYELGDYPKAARVLGELIERWPSASYYKQLAGMLGLMELQSAQLAVMHAAYVNNMLDSESELLNMARLYMAEDAPHPAIELLDAAMQAGTVEATADNLQLLAQAMALGKEYERQVPVLARAAELSGDARQYVYLGQAQIALNQWAAAAEALEQALSIGGLDRPGSIYMQLGTAYFNLKRHGPARQAFKQAAAYDDYRQQAQQWVAFVNSEVERERALRGG
ncbi:MAG: tetratricopeptide repeat protein [Pseudomonadota bacterium]|nr:tetratricopeptide repeat protein [Pseudomonadota bacterium]